MSYRTHGFIERQALINEFGKLAVDFEYVLRKLTDALEVTNLYEESKNLTKEIEEDVKNLKKILIDLISKPLKRKDIAEEQYVIVSKIFKKF